MQHKGCGYLEATGTNVSSGQTPNAKKALTKHAVRDILPPFALTCSLSCSAVMNDQSSQFARRRLHDNRDRALISLSRSFV
jgi:hypothetical protein